MSGPDIKLYKTFHSVSYNSTPESNILKNSNLTSKGGKVFSFCKILSWVDHIPPIAITFWLSLWSRTLGKNKWKNPLQSARDATRHISSAKFSLVPSVHIAMHKNYLAFFFSQFLHSIIKKHLFLKFCSNKKQIMMSSHRLGGCSCTYLDILVYRWNHNGHLGVDNIQPKIDFKIV